MNKQRVFACASAGHGKPDIFIAGGESALKVDAKVMARTLLENGYTKGTPVDLISCSTGVYGDGTAYQLSRYLKAPVTAPTNLISVTNSGGYMIRDFGRMRTFFNTTIK